MPADCGLALQLKEITDGIGQGYVKADSVAGDTRWSEVWWDEMSAVMFPLVV